MLALLDALPPAKTLLVGKGYDTDWSCGALEDKGVAAGIPARRGRKTPASHDRKFFTQRCRIESLVARSEDWRQIATCDDRCGERFPSA